MAQDNCDKAKFLGEWTTSTGNKLILLSNGKFTYDHEPSWWCMPLYILPFINAFLSYKISGQWDFVDSRITVQDENSEVRVWKVKTVTDESLVIINENDRELNYKRKH